VLETFNETTAASTSGKLIFGLIAAIWSASVGISAIQDTLNIVYKVQVMVSFRQACVPQKEFPCAIQ
jgi:membrane protein